MNSIIINIDNNTDLNVIYNQLKKQYPKFEIIKNTENVEDVKVFEKYLSEVDYKYNNTKYIFNEPYLLTVHRKKGNDIPFWYCVEDKNLGIDIMEESLEEAISVFYSEIDFLWRNYASEKDEKLTKGAVILKNNVKDLIKEALEENLL